MTLINPPIPSSRPGPRPKRWSGQEYDRLVALGAFDHQRVELINGEVVEMSPMGQKHGLAILLTQYTLMHICPADAFTVKPQIPFKLNAKSRPEPDVAVYRGNLRQTEDFGLKPLLAIEVADSSLEYDREVKLPAYASQLIPEIWIINLIDDQIEVYRDPHPINGDAFAYSPAIFRKRGDTLATLFAPQTPIPAIDLLP
jgi:Uma2 family endonuclease